jgi:hypothetical protein
MTKLDKAVRLACLELIQHAALLGASGAGTVLYIARREAESILREGPSDDMPAAATRFYRRCVARLRTMESNDRIGMSELAAWD